MYPKVSIIFPIHNGKSDTLNCLRSLNLLSYPKNSIEIIMIDNASTDNSVSIVAKNYPKVKIIELSKNVGFAKAINKGVKIAKGRYVFIINNDVLFDKDYLSNLIRFLNDNPETGIAGGKIYYQKPKTKILFSGLHFNPWTGTIARLPKPDVTKESEWIQGCAMLVKRGVFRKIGYFDEGFFFSFEDADFCLRARHARFKVIYYPEAYAWHKEGATINRFGLERKSEELYKAKFRYIFKNCSVLQIIVSTLIQFLIIAPLRIFIIQTPYFSLNAMVKGYTYNVARIKEIMQKRE